MINLEREFPRIGNRQPPDESSQQSEGWTRPKLPTPSVTTGSPQTGRQPPKETGLQRSAPGAVARESIPPEEAAKLAPFALPEGTMRCMSSSVASRIAVETNPVIGTDGQFEGVALRRFWIKPGISPEELSQSLNEL